MNKTTIGLYYVPLPDHTELVSYFYLQVLNIPLVLLASLINLIVFVVILSTSNLREKASLIFILSLTFADLLIAAIDVPLIIALVEAVGQNSPLHARLEWSIFYINWITFGASSLSLLAASLDRMVFVSSPFIYEKIITAKRAFLCVTLIWIGSIITFCLVWLNNGNVFAYQLFVLVSLLIFLVSYACVHFRIICVVRHLVAPVSASNNSERFRTANTVDDEDGKATQTAFVLILTFLICWLPMVVTGFIWTIQYPKGYPKGYQEENSESKIFIVSELYFWFEFVAHFHCLLNPFVFTIKDNRIRTRIVSIVRNMLRRLKSSSALGGIPEVK